MPNNGTAKTASALKRIWWGVVLCAFVGLTVGVVLLARTSRPLQATVNGSAYELTLGGSHADEQAGVAPQTRGRTYYLSGATTSDQQVKGLSGTPSLGTNKGMVFIYPDQQERCFWMKDMHYSLDILWLDNDKKVTAIERDVSPDTYPRTFCHQGRYVVELNSGEADKNGTVLGQQLQF